MSGEEPTHGRFIRYGGYNRRRLLRLALAGATLGVLRTGPAGIAAAGAARPTTAARVRRDQQPPAGSIVAQWNTAALQAIRDTKPGPPMAARMLAVLHTCMYDAWAMYDPVALPTAAAPALRVTGTANTPENKRLAVSVAAYRALVDLFPAETAVFYQVMTGLGYAPGNQPQVAGSPTDLGNQCARAVLDLRHGDGANQLGDLHPGPYTDYTGYQPVNTPDTIADPDHWQPLRIPDGKGGSNVQVYVGPFWGQVTPFAMTSGSQFRPVDGPATYGTDLYKQQADLLLAYSYYLTDEQKIITEFWADGPGTDQPPGHWCRFGQFIALRDQHDFDTDVQFFFILSNALLDAGIACWDAKRVWNSVRPITAVHFLYQGQQIQAWGGPFRGPATMLGEDWQVYQSPVVVTPSFPEFFSGHSTFSAAAAEVLLRFTGSDAFGASATIAAGSSALEPGAVPAQDLTLPWDTFSAAADQAGLSRRYGGIHFVQGDLTGRAVGRQVGAQVWDRAQAYITGAG